MLLFLLNLMGQGCSCIILQTENEVIGSEEMTEGSGSYTVHGAWLQIHQDGSGNIFGGWKETKQMMIGYRPKLDAHTCMHSYNQTIICYGMAD